MVFKEDYPPMLPPGHHTITLQRLKRMCVDPFPNSKNRRIFYYNLEILVQELLISGIFCELWVDGSYLTEKEEPKDIDVLLKLDLDVSEKLTREQRILVDKVTNGIYRANLDSFSYV